MTKRYAVTATVVFALLVAACGGGRTEGSGVASIGRSQDDRGTQDGNKPPSVDSEQAALAFARCMRQNGVNMPDPDADGMIQIQPGDEPPSQDDLATAEAACKTEREALQGAIGEPSKDFQDKALAMSRCMREQGVDMPDPQMGEGGSAAIQIDRELIESPEFKRAQETCRKQVGMPEPGGAGVVR